jgi:NAD(P)-dependent dehydrogenase (short-subunit alcohol dehydrogenase family)
LTVSVTYNFEGQVDLVTGAASGMGLDSTRAFARTGAAVTLADVTEDVLRQAVDEIKSAGGNAIGVLCNVAGEAQVAAMVQQTVAGFGRLDAAFNNAGVMLPAVEIADVSREEYDRISDIASRCVELHETRAASHS